MKDLSYLREGPGCSWFKVAIGSGKTNAAILELVRCAVYERYREFDGFMAVYDTEPRKTGISISGHVLREFYERPPSALKLLLQARRRDHALDECPSCGSPRPPETLDHFLPKEDWPEYAIFSDNLVPQCRGCAPIKGVKYFSKKEKQSLFLHPMYSPELSTLRFKIHVKMVGGKPNFSPVFSIPESVAESDLERVILHLDSLQVRARIVCFCREEYRHWIRLAQSKPCDIKSMLESRLSERVCDPYPNNWATAFYKGILDSPDAVRDLQQHIVSKPPKPGEKHRFF